MKVKIKLFATLRNFGPEEQEVELPDNATLEVAIKLLKLPEKISLLRIVNGEHRNLKYPLKEGDEIALFPPIAGGQHTPYTDEVGTSGRRNNRKEYPVVAGQPSFFMKGAEFDRFSVETYLHRSLC
jgi:molybdopterin converting factor small subunit